ncbi:thiopeptide-type bacteriocin biosynthesis protein [Herbidospora sp. RD11066]
MSADRLICDAVLEVVSGARVVDVAAVAGMDPVDLGEAVEVYHSAGLAALQRREDHEWYQVRVRFPDWNTAEAVVASRLGPDLDQLQTAGWWFLRKHPHWRIRLRHADTASVDEVLDRLVVAGVLTGWQRGLYEPETVAFGGSVALRAVHELFCADSRGVLDHVRQGTSGLGRRELSLLLLGAFLAAAELDTFEQGDVFARVARLRPTPDSAALPRIREMAASARILLAAPGAGSSWRDAFVRAGRQLHEAAVGGQLERGIRAILTHLIIFHWNRIGLSAGAQAVLARAANAALLPED